MIKTGDNLTNAKDVCMALQTAISHENQYVVRVLNYSDSTLILLLTAWIDAWVCLHYREYYNLNWGHVLEAAWLY